MSLMVSEASGYQGRSRLDSSSLLVCVLTRHLTVTITMSAAFCVELATSINGTEATSLKACLGDASAITEFMRFYGYYSNTITLQAIKTLFK